MSIVNFTLVVVIVLVFLRLNRWNRAGGSLTWPSARYLAGWPPASRPHPAGRRPRRARLRRCGPAIIAAAAYVVAVIFLLPYLEMLVTAVRPQRELYERELPAAPLRLVEPHQHVGRRVRHHVRPCG